jgi:hypothetical protein
VKTIAIVFLVLLAGCNEYLPETDRKQAALKCDVNGGVSAYQVYDQHTLKIVCNNGAMFYRPTEDRK